MAEYPRRDQLTGDAPGCEHQPVLPVVAARPRDGQSRGQTAAAHERRMQLQLVLLLGCPVDPRLGWQRTPNPESVCITHNPTHALAGSAREIHAPTFKPKESLA